MPMFHVAKAVTMRHFVCWNIPHQSKIFKNLDSLRVWTVSQYACTQSAFDLVVTFDLKLS